MHVFVERHNIHMRYEQKKKQIFDFRHHMFGHHKFVHTYKFKRTEITLYFSFTVIFIVIEKVQYHIALCSMCTVQSKFNNFKSMFKCVNCN